MLKLIRNLVVIIGFSTVLFVPETSAENNLSALKVDNLEKKESAQNQRCTKIGNWVIFCFTEIN